MIFYNLFRHSPEFLEIKSGDVLLHENDVGDEMYVLIEGRAKIEFRSFHLGDVLPGEFVGELAVIDGSPRLATVTAVTNCKFVTINRHRFEVLVADTPHFALEVMRVLASRLRKTNELLTQLSGESA